MLDDFRDHHFLRALAAHAVAFVFLQTFAIPGTTFANLSKANPGAGDKVTTFTHASLFSSYALLAVGGALFGRVLGFLVCILWSTVGAVVLYFNSKVSFLRTPLDPRLD